MQKLVWAQEVLRVGFNVGQDLPEGGVTTLRLRKSGDEAGPPFFVQLVLSLLPSHLCAHLLRFLSFALRSVLVRLPPRAMTAPFRRLNLVSRLRERLLSLQERAERHFGGERIPGLLDDPGVVGIRSKRFVHFPVEDKSSSSAGGTSIDTHLQRNGSDVVDHGIGIDRLEWDRARDSVALAEVVDRATLSVLFQLRNERSSRMDISSMGPRCARLQGYACAGGTNESSEMYGTSWSSAPRYGAHGMISSLLKIVPFALYFVKTSFKNSSMTSRGGTHPASAASAHSTSREEEECRTGTATERQRVLHHGVRGTGVHHGFEAGLAGERNGEDEGTRIRASSLDIGCIDKLDLALRKSHLDPALGNLEENGLETLDRHVRAISTTLAQRPPLGVGLVVVVRIDEASVKLDADLLERPRTRHLAKVDRRHQQVVVEVLRDLATGPSDWVRILKNQRSSACGRLSRPVYFSVISLLKGTRKLRRSGTLRIDPGLGYFLDFFLCTTLNPSYDPDKPSLIEPSESDPSEESPDDEGGPPPSPPPPPAALSRTVSAYDLSALRLIECLAGNLPFSASDSG
ncbi:hypothetical protein RTBOTA2_007011 [Rhodotorula toruloides]|nr:hypothetical protein RTBOTA2_007011 [Rhodotorula toruloides]